MGTITERMKEENLKGKDDEKDKEGKAQMKWKSRLCKWKSCSICQLNFNISTDGA